MWFGLLVTTSFSHWRRDSRRVGEVLGPHLVWWFIVHFLLLSRAPWLDACMVISIPECIIVMKTLDPCTPTIRISLTATSLQAWGQNFTALLSQNNLRGWVLLCIGLRHHPLGECLIKSWLLRLSSSSGRSFKYSGPALTCETHMKVWAFVSLSQPWLLQAFWEWNSELKTLAFASWCFTFQADEK